MVGALRDRAQRACGQDHRVRREPLERLEPRRARPVGGDDDGGGGGGALELLDDVGEQLDLVRG